MAASRGMLASGPSPLESLFVRAGGAGGSGEANLASLPLLGAAPISATASSGSTLPSVRTPYRMEVFGVGWMGSCGAFNGGRHTHRQGANYRAQGCA